MSERERHKSLSPYSRMALVVRGWGLEVGCCLGVLFLWRVAVTSGGEGLGVLAFGLLGIAVWRLPTVRDGLARTLRTRSTRRWFNRVLIACALISRHGAIPTVEGIEVIPAGKKLHLRLPAGFTAELLENEVELLAATMGVREVRVVRDVANASIAHLSIVRRDPLGVPAPRWPGPPRSLWDPISLGVDEDGNPVRVGLPERNILLGGEPGAGKSAALSLFIASAAMDPDVRLTLMDGKQVELAPWRESATAFVGPDMDEAIDVLKDLCSEMDHRYGVLLESGLRKIAPGGRFGLYVLAVDELAYYMRGGSKDQRTELAERLRDLISRGRAAGMIVIAATQKPSNDIIPTFVRDLFSFRMALRCTTPEASDTILGQGWASQGFSAATLDPRTRGVGFLLAEGAGPVKIRTHYLDDDDIAELARIAARRRNPW